MTYRVTLQRQTYNDLKKTGKIQKKKKKHRTQPQHSCPYLSLINAEQILLYIQKLKPFLAKVEITDKLENVLNNENNKSSEDKKSTSEKQNKTKLTPKREGAHKQNENHKNNRSSESNK